MSPAQTGAKESGKLSPVFTEQFKHAWTRFDIAQEDLDALQSDCGRVRLAADYLDWWQDRKRLCSGMNLVKARPRRG